MISMIAAMTNNRVIGKDNELPWHVPEDFEWFRENTKGKPVIMGRKTHESMGKVLKGRTNIVISKNLNYIPIDNSVKVYNNISEAVASCEANEIMIIGGQQIYEQALQYTDRIYLTIFDTMIEGDAFFPILDESWKIIYKRSGKTNIPFPYSFNIFERK